MAGIGKSEAVCRRIVLAARPTEKIAPEQFRLEHIPVPDPDELLPGQVLVDNHFLSLDPYMRGRMATGKSYAPPQPLDQTMVGETAGVVIASRYTGIVSGDTVVGRLGWTEVGLADGAALRKVDTSRVALSAHLGVLGMPGVTAWYGVNRILQAQAGQTVMVTAAGGAVGSIAGQLAKLAGCRVIGVAGGAAKCQQVVRQFGFDACVDYKQASSAKMLRKLVAEAAPQGIDRLFENVGSSVFDACLANLNPYAKVALCGMVAGYDQRAEPLTFVNRLLTMRASLQGFIVTEHRDVWPQALAELEQLVIDQKLICQETVAQGLDRAPEALIGLLAGHNLGKQLVRLKPTFPERARDGR